MFELFWTFFKIGLFTFGGGYAMIATVREAVVQTKKWLTEEEFLEIIAIAESTPGPIAINMATYVGYKRRGVLGSAAATFGVVLPSMIIIFTISLFLDAFMKNRFVAYAFRGIQCAVAFLITRAGWDMFRKTKRRPLPLVSFGTVLVLMILFDLFAVQFSSVFFILIGGIIGIVAYALLNREEVQQ
ncbi:MAG: chromate transporter [Ruminococcaceae bacterium]|nr:chromate transporter [Oscillospiraceae bacterium]